MATGDMSNNIRKLTGKLKAVQYPDGVDVKVLADGSPTVYLPIYHHMFTSYSPALAEQILARDIELFGKSDARFMEAAYKVLRDLFSYKPPITKEQFFSKGFSERKVIMCADIVQLIRDRYPVSTKTTLRTSVRPKSAVDTGCQTVPKTKRPSSGKRSPRDTEAGSASVAAPHVVNELKAAPSSAPVRHMSYSMAHRNPVRHIASQSGQPFSSVDESQPRSVPDQVAQYVSRGQPAKHVTIITPRTEEELKRRSDRQGRLLHHSDREGRLLHHSDQEGRSLYHSDQEGRSLYHSDQEGRSLYHSDQEGRSLYQGPGDMSPEQLQPVASTPSIARVCRDSVEVVNMPRSTRDESIVEIRAPTSDSVLQAPVPDSSPEVRGQISRLSQTVETLTQHVRTFDQALKTVQSGGSDPYIRQLEERIQGQINNLMARMVLLENRVSIIEATVDDVNKSNFSSVQSNSIVTHPTAPVGMVSKPPLSVNVAPLPVNMAPDASYGTDSTLTSFGEELAHLTTPGNQRVRTICSESGDASLDYSPIRKVPNSAMGQLMSANEDTFVSGTEDDARRSSTPTSMQESSLWLDFSNVDTNEAALRIKQM